MLGGCVIHRTPKLKWCMNKACVMEGYGINNLKDKIRKKKVKIVMLVKRANSKGSHDKKELPKFVSKKALLNSETKTVSNEIKDTVSLENNDIVIGRPVDSKKIHINFTFDNDTISVQDKKNIAEYLREVPIETIVKMDIKGFTDNAGSDEYNKHLSIKRAKRVFDYLISLGFPNSKLSYQGFDHHDPVADNNTEEGRRLNRRVEIEIIKKTF